MNRSTRARAILKMSNILVVFGILLIHASFSLGATYYISKSGSDSNNGLSWTAAWATVAKVNSSIHAADTVRFGSGKWLNSQINAIAGTFGHPTVYACSTVTSPSFGRTTISAGDSVRNWTLRSGNIYKAYWRRSSIVAYGMDNYDVNKAYILVCNDSTLYPQTSLANVSAAGQFFHNSSNDTVYAWFWGNASPSGKEVLIAGGPTVIISADRDYIGFVGLNFKMGKQGIVEVSARSDSLSFIHCLFQHNSNRSTVESNNPSLVFFGEHYYPNRYIRFIACDFRDCYRDDFPDQTAAWDHGGTGIKFYYTQNSVVDSCTFLRCAGDGIKYKSSRGAYSINNAVRNSIFYGNVGGANTSITDVGVMLSMRVGTDSVYGCTFISCGKGIGVGDMGAAGSDFVQESNNFIANNTFYNCGYFLEIEGMQQLRKEFFKYNAAYNYTGSRGISFAEQSGSYAHLEDSCVFDSNMWYDPTSFAVRLASGTLNWAQWQALGKDVHSSWTVNPGFNNPTANDFSRPSAGNEMNLTYGGRTWTRFGAWQSSTPPPPAHISQSISRSSTTTTVTLSDDLSNGTVPYDSLILYWSATRANVVNLSARDTKVTATADPYTFSKTGLTVNTKYYFRISAFDTGANPDTSAIDSVTTNTVPSIDQVVTKSSTTTTATLSDNLTGGTAPYDSLILYWSVTRANVANLSARDTKVTVATDPYVYSKTALTAGTKYYFRISAFDTGANPDTSAIDSVTTTSVPSIDQVVTKSSTTTTATLSDNLTGGTAPYDSLILYWSTTRANVANLSARDTKVTVATDPYVYSKTALTAGTKYYFRISAFDTGANPDTSAIDSVTTTSVPSIDQVVTKSSTTISATLSDNLTGGTAPYDSLILYWSTTRANVVNLSARDTKATATADPYTFTKTGLTANTKYYFRISAFDAGANPDTSAIDSVTTSTDTGGYTLLSVGAADSVSGTYSGYVTPPINDGIINPRGGTSTTWASDQNAAVPHWVEMTLNSPRTIRRVRIYWAWNNYSSGSMCSQQYSIQYWNTSSNAYVDVATINNSTVDSVTSTDITPVTTNKIRYWQPANMGPASYASILWLTEMELYGQNPGDTTAPILSNIQASAISNTSATITWTTNEVATTQVDYGFTTAYGLSSILDTNRVLSHTAALTGLRADTLYHFRVRSRDMTGNQAISGDFNFHTSSAANLISIGVPVSVCGTYSGYLVNTINDGVINPRGGTATTWASDQSATSPHWIVLTFSSPIIVQQARIFWAYNVGHPAWMCSRQYSIQYWDATTGAYRDAAVVNNATADSVTVTNFTPVTTTRIRYWQPANMGPATYASILWIAELELYGYSVSGLALPPAAPIKLQAFPAGSAAYLD